MDRTASASPAGSAYALARIGLGINFTLHGWTRVFAFSAFASHTQEQFAKSPLPPALVHATTYAIVASESSIGPLLLLGLFTRFALTWAGFLLWALLFGTCLIQNWNTAGDQLVYLAFVAGLMATIRHNAWSLDSLRGVRTVVGAKPVP